MTTPTLTCEHCESEIDVEKDPKCVVYDPSGATDVICESCRDRRYERWLVECEQDGWPVEFTWKLREAHRIKRGWQA